MINLFRGEHEFLSNFYTLTTPIVYGWMVARTSEHLFAAFKTINDAQREWVLEAGNAAIAKRRGRQVTLRPDWNTGFDKTAMHLTLILKFSTNESLRSRLIGTENKQLIEGNWWHDNYWGDCTCAGCTNIPGLNNLGILHMQVRSLFQQFQSHIRTN